MLQSILSNVNIICTGDDHNYYLAKLIANIHETGESGMDDNNHEMPVHQNHLLLPGDYKNIKESTTRYTENKKKTILSTYSVAGVCATPEIHWEKGGINAGYVFSDT